MEFRSAFFALLICGWLVACQGPTPVQYFLAAPDLEPPIQARQEVGNDPTESTIGWNPDEGLPALLQRAETSSPEVRAAFQRWQAARARVPQVQALPNPWVSLGGYVQSVETRTGPMDGRLGINQVVPWPGKLETAGNRAAALAEGVRMETDHARLAVRRQFLRDWTERVYLAQAERITEVQVLLLQHIEDVSLSLYESSAVSQADVLRAQVERLEMADRLDTLRQREAPLIAALEATLGAPLTGDFRWESQSLLGLETLPSDEILRQTLLETSPELIALQARISAAREGEHLAGLNGLPNFSLGADWTWIGEGNPTQPGSGDDAFAITLAIELPIQRGSIQGSRSQALAERIQVMELRSQRQWQLLAALQSAAASHEDALRRISLFHDQLQPKAEQTYETTLAAYQSGQAAFQDMLDAARVVLEFRLSAARAAADAALAYADINGLIPVPLVHATESNR